MPSVPYWSGSPQQWQLIQEVQEAKREYIDPMPGSMYGIKSDQYVLVNPVTGREPSAADLAYARDHLQQIYESGAIREERWAFLWYH